MRHARHLAYSATACVLLLCGPPAQAGQVRIDVSNNFFSPDQVSLNLGDHVVWVWIGTGHTVTSGDDGSPFGDGRFHSGFLALNAGAAFSWKSNVVMDGIPYYCRPHWPDMVASLDVKSSGVPVSAFRLTEVKYSTTHDDDFVEIANLGGAAGNLGRYRLSLAEGSTLTLPLSNIVVQPDSRVVVHFNRSGTNSQTHLYFPAVTIPTTGSVALYVPHTANAGNPPASLSDPNQIIDFVQWGAGGQPNSSTAAAAGLWSVAGFLPTVADGHSMEFCGTATNRGGSFWHESATPSPGTSGNCATPVTPTSWGRIKTLYR